MQPPYFIIGNVNVCTYCGNSAGEIDHIFSVSSQTLVKNPRSRRTGFGPVCHSCGNCNWHLGNKYFTNFDDRCRTARDMDYRASIDWYGTRDFYINLEAMSWEPYLEEGNDKFRLDVFNYFKPTLIMIKAICQWQSK